LEFNSNNPQSLTEFVKQYQKNAETDKLGNNNIADTIRLIKNNLSIIPEKEKATNDKEAEKILASDSSDKDKFMAVVELNTRPDSVSKALNGISSELLPESIAKIQLEVFKSNPKILND